jgi:ADP-heptose:LPS heptosyltransferase
MKRPAPHPLSGYREAAAFVWSGIGDALMALPLLRGLRRSGRASFLLGKASSDVFYRFLQEEGVITGFRTYQRHSGSGFRAEWRSWAEAFSGWELVLLPPRSSIAAARREQRLLNLLLRSSALALPVMRLSWGIGRIEYIAEAPTEGIGEANRSLSYRRCLAAGFGVEPEPGDLFFSEETTARCVEAALPWLAAKNLSPGNYAVLYAATQGRERDLPGGLIAKINRLVRDRGLRLALVGDPAHGGEWPADLLAHAADCRGRREFRELLGLLGLSRAVFSVDGGLLHLALAARSPRVVSFWGPSSPRSRVGPDYPQHRALWRDLGFQPCLGRPEAFSRRAEMFDFSDREIAEAAGF